MLRAVLFDWGETLMEVRFDEELMAHAFRRGIEALDRYELAPADDVLKHFREQFEPLFWVPGTLEEVEYPGVIRETLRHFGVEVLDEELNRFLEAEHEAWQ